MVEKYPQHRLATSTASPKEKALSLRGSAQEDDPLALEIFDLQAKVMGVHIANLMMAFDAEFVVIDGGLLNPEATTVEFRARDLRTLRTEARRYFFPIQRERVKFVPATLGELSQAVGRGPRGVIHGAGREK